MVMPAAWPLPAHISVAQIRGLGSSGTGSMNTLLKQILLAVHSKSCASLPDSQTQCFAYILTNEHAASYKYQEVEVDGARVIHLQAI